MKVGIAQAFEFTQNLKMSDDFTTAVSAVIPVIILAAVLEASVYYKRMWEASEKGDIALAATIQDVRAHLEGGEKVPVELARRYRDAEVEGLEAWVHGAIAVVWFSIVSLLSIVEVVDLYLLALDAEHRDYPHAVLMNLGVIGLGFALLVVLPAAARIAEMWAQKRDLWKKWDEQRLTVAEHRSLLARAEENDVSSSSTADG